MASAALTFLALGAISGQVAQAAPAKSSKPVPEPSPVTVPGVSTDPTWAASATGVFNADWLFDVGCTTGTGKVCVAAGFNPYATGSATPVEVYQSHSLNGATNYGQWDLAAAPQAGANVGPNAVACPAKSDKNNATSQECIAAGNAGYVALATGLTTSNPGGTVATWTKAAAPTGSPDLYGAACLSDFNCWVVGSGGLYNTTNMLASPVVWTKYAATTNLPVYTGISCFTSSFGTGGGTHGTANGTCVAVGSNATYTVITEALDVPTGATTATQITATTGGFSTADWLNDVDCLSATNCYAAADKGYALKWNGTTWVITPPTLAGSCNNQTVGAACTGDTQDLLGVGCATTTLPAGDNCSMGGYGGIIVTTNDGSGLTYVNDHSSTTQEIDGLACPNVDATHTCYAVGAAASLSVPGVIISRGPS